MVVVVRGDIVSELVVVRGACAGCCFSGHVVVRMVFVVWRMPAECIKAGLLG